MNRRDYLTPEELRILNAAKDGRIELNAYGRWVIYREERPNRKARESLVARGFMAYASDDPAYPRGRYVLSSRGHRALSARFSEERP